METVSYPVCTCCRCNHRWIARTTEPPVRCANQNCRSPYWNTRKPQSVVYVIAGWGAPNRYKIGHSINFKARYGTRKLGDPNGPGVIIEIPSGGNVELETAIHKLFESKRVGALESFDLTDVDLRILHDIEQSLNPLQYVIELLSKLSQ